eukprot:CAMPEP_0182928154 /NCGR_PEP_ID=MMETSP0105_2-20130417/15344_1 /TAXON_ID=81532 ORGANISM="Acanthoeca-like sp., Strain 10tr" /NCGR_SAMPLE_ID=MMETSP0105_2 /ASSEMBLY_ACC=CAM_ASM_000205 /LENGTH=103 /DNA_ID=CAMNT_0025066147 /DNA_START=11 /DNA_END=322 /DNA_ORIENTATION=+
MAAVRHVVMLKYAEGQDKAAAHKALSDGLAEFSANIPQIVSMKFGPDLGLDPARNHDYVITVDFKSNEDYNTYAVHPFHVEFIKTVIKPVLAPGGRSAVQFAL